MLGLVISMIVIGVIACTFPRLIIHARQDISIPMTGAIGIVGGFLDYEILRGNGAWRRWGRGAARTIGRLACVRVA